MPADSRIIPASGVATWAGNNRHPTELLSLSDISFQGGSGSVIEIRPVRKEVVGARLLIGVGDREDPAAIAPLPCHHLFETLAGQVSERTAGVGFWAVGTIPAGIGEVMISQCEDVKILGVGILKSLSRSIATIGFVGVVMRS